MTKSAQVYGCSRNERGIAILENNDMKDVFIILLISLSYLMSDELQELSNHHPLTCIFFRLSTSPTSPAHFENASHPLLLNIINNTSRYTKIDRVVVKLTYCSECNESLE